MHAHTHTCTHMYTHVHIYTYNNTCACTHMTHMDTHARTYTHIHTHVHTYKHRLIYTIFMQYMHTHWTQMCKKMCVHYEQLNYKGGTTLHANGPKHPPWDQRTGPNGGGRGVEKMRFLKAYYTISMHFCKFSPIYEDGWVG